MKINVRDVIRMSLEEICDSKYDNVVFEVAYDDGVLKSDNRYLSIDHHLYDIVRPYMGTPNEPKIFNKDISVRSLEHITGNSIKRIMSTLSKGVKLTDINNEVLSEETSQNAYLSVNKIYNFIYDKPEYTFSFSFVDLINVLFDDDIAEINRNISSFDPDPEKSVLIAQQKVKDIIMTKDIKGYKGSDNELTKVVRNNLAPVVQTLQLVTAVGRRNDIDGSIMNRVIPSSYGGGLNKIEDLVLDSRTSSLALYYQKNPLKKVEYLNRRSQLAAMYIRSIKGIDCGNRKTMTREVSENDYESIMGKWSLTDDGKWVVVTKEIAKKHIGKSIKLRMLQYCQNPDNQTKCRMCYGYMHTNIPKNTNVGNLSGTATGKDNTQNTLAVKHSVASSITGGIHIVGDAEKRYLTAGKNKRSVHLSDKISPRRKVYIKLKNDVKKSEDPLTEKGLLLDLVNNAGEATAGNLDKMNPHEVVSFKNVTIMLCDASGKGVVEEELYVRTGSRDAAFSLDALRFIVSDPTRVVVDSKGVVTIDFTGYPRSKKLFVYHKKMDSFLDFSASLEEILMSKGSANNYQGFPIHHLSKFDNPEDAVNYLCDFLNLKNLSNIVHAEILVNVFSCKDPDNGNYNLPDPGTAGVIVGYDALMQYRSMSGAMANGYHFQILKSLGNCFKSNDPSSVPSHPMDNFLFS